MNIYIFIDETGSPQLYAKRKRPLWIEPDFVPVICLGMVVTNDRIKLRKDITDFQKQVLNDPLLNSIYSVSQPGWFFHARRDHSDINFKMVDFLRQLNSFNFSAVIGRKIPEIFINKHNGNAIEFYFDLIHKLLELDHLHADAKYHLYLSQRQSSTVQRFTEAFEKAVKAKRMEIERISFSCSIVRSCDFPELSVADYLLWALQRYILKGERRYFAALEKHYEKILDVYDNDGSGKLYGVNDPFTLEKASAFNMLV
jgi:hypothetical protein